MTIKIKIIMSESEITSSKMNSKFYKYCVVPQCESTTIKTPSKLFIYVPHNETIRKKWLTFAKRDPNAYSKTTRIYFCEDHFNLPHDMENYMEYKLKGFVSQIRLKPGRIPTKYECQTNRKNRTCNNSTDKSYVSNKHRRMIIKECLREAVDSDTQHSDDQDTSEKSLDVHEEDLPFDNKTDKSTDVLNAEEFGDEAINLNKRMNKICRICLEEGVLSSVFTKNFNTSVNEMIEYCCNIKIYKDDGLPELVCSNCIYKLGVAYHFKKTCESANLKLRQYLGVELPNKTKDAAIMTDPVQPQTIIKRCKCKLSSRKSSSTYKRKPESEKQKRGPKPKQKEIHSCFECDKQFRCQAQLEMHVRTHTGDKPFVCMYCPRRFTQKHNLTIHLRIHTGEKPFQCDVCSKRFSAQGNLNAHLKIHTGQRDHVCTLCNKPFITSSELTRHMNKHRGVKNFKCDLCEASYVHLRDLKLHKLKKHQMTINSQSKVNSDNHSNRNIIDVIGLDVEKDAQMAGNSSSHMMPQLIQKPLQQPITEQSQPIIYKDTKDIFPQYTSDSMLNNHSCTICGEGFEYITALAQHYLHSHKDFDYTQSKGYNLVS